MKKIVISGNVKAEVDALLNDMAALSKVKAGKLISKDFGVDKRLNSFLNANFDSGLTIFTDKDKRQKMLDALADHGITSVTKRRALLIAMAAADVDGDVTAMEAFVTNNGKAVLDAEQKEKLVKKLVEYKNFLRTKLTAGIEDLAKFTGAFTTEEVVEPVEAEVVN